MHPADFRSDTVTEPTPAMREAMFTASVGDDVYHDDPTVNALQELAAARVGKEAGLFVPSGTMGNLIAILTHCGRGDEIIMGKHSHTFLYEGGGISTLGGVHSSQIPELADGSLDLDEIAANIRPPEDDHEPITRLVEIENTHNRAGGVYQTPKTVRRLAEFVHARGLLIHMDGARLFNAAVAQNVDVKDLTQSVDSVTFCLSKGLCAPVGSVLCGSREFITRARKIRKHLGGGMRQAGILAAAGIVALETMVTRLAEDHARALRLAEGLQTLPNIRIWPGLPATNMVFFDILPQVSLSDHEIEQKLQEHGVLVHTSNPRRLRLVTHYWIDDAAIDLAINALGAVLA